MNSASSTVHGGLTLQSYRSARYFHNTRDKL